MEPNVNPVLISKVVASQILKLYNGKVSEPEIKFVFLILALLAFLAVYSGSEAVLPAYIIGMAMAGFFLQYKETLHKMRAIAFVAFTPFYFIKAGAIDRGTYSCNVHFRPNKL